MKLHTKIYGNKPDILYIIHGLLGMGDNWYTLAMRYSEHFTVMLPDMRNHGNSPHSDDFSYSLMVNDIIELMNENKQTVIHIIGHSMGGKVAMHLAMNHPERIQSLIVADIGIAPYKAGHDHILQTMLAMPIQDFTSRNEAERYMIQNGYSKQGERLFLLKNLTRDDRGNFIWKPNLESLKQNYNNIIQGVEGYRYIGPSLFLYGGRSEYLRPIDFQLIPSLFPRAEFESIAGTGHWLHAEKPDIFYEKTMRFITRKD